MSGTNAKWVLFDVGNVLVRFDHRRFGANLHACLAGTGGAPTPEAIHEWAFVERTDGLTPNERLDRGLARTEAIHQEFERAFGVRVDFADFRRCFAEVFDPIDEAAYDCARRLRERGLHLGLCSDTNEAHWAYLEPLLEPLGIDPRGRCLSFELGVCKPTAEYFHAVLARTGAPGPNHVLFDDRPPNVANLPDGMHGQVFTDFDAVLAWVDGQGW